MIPKDYKLMVRCVEDAVSYGYHKAHKHTNAPSEQVIIEHIEQAVIDEICEWFYFTEVERYEA